MSDCARPITFWDGDYEGACILPPDHEGLHDDGECQFDDDGKFVIWNGDLDA